MTKEMYAHFTDLLLEYRCHRLKFFPCDSDKNKQLRNISNTSKAGFNRLKNTEKWDEKRGEAEFFFNQLQGVWKWDKTPFRVFDIPSQTIHLIILGGIQSKSLP